MYIHSARWVQFTLQYGDKDMKKGSIRGISFWIAVSLVSSATLASAPVAHAQVAEAVGFIKTAADVIKKGKSLHDLFFGKAKPKPITVADLNRIRDEIVGEIRTVRNDQLASTVQSLMNRSREVAREQDRTLSTARLANLLDDSSDALYQINNVVRSADGKSAYHLLDAYYTVGFLRVVTLQTANSPGAASVRDAIKQVRSTHAAIEKRSALWNYVMEKDAAETTFKGSYASLRGKGNYRVECEVVNGATCQVFCLPGECNGAHFFICLPNKTNGVFQGCGLFTFYHPPDYEDPEIKDATKAATKAMAQITSTRFLKNPKGQLQSKAVPAQLSILGYPVKS